MKNVAYCSRLLLVTGAALIPVLPAMASDQEHYFDVPNPFSDPLTAIEFLDYELMLVDGDGFQYPAGPEVLFGSTEWGATDFIAVARIPTSGTQAPLQLSWITPMGEPQAHELLSGHGITEQSSSAAIHTALSHAQTSIINYNTAPLVDSSDVEHDLSFLSASVIWFEFENDDNPLPGGWMVGILVEFEDSVDQLHLNSGNPQVVEGRFLIPVKIVPTSTSALAWVNLLTFRGWFEPSGIPTGLVAEYGTGSRDRLDVVGPNPVVFPSDYCFAIFRAEMEEIRLNHRAGFLACLSEFASDFKDTVIAAIGCCGLGGLAGSIGGGIPGAIAACRFGIWVCGLIGLGADSTEGVLCIAQNLLNTRAAINAAGARLLTCCATAEPPCNLPP